MVNHTQNMAFEDHHEAFLLQARAQIDAELANLKLSKRQPTATARQGQPHLTQDMLPRGRSQIGPSMSRTVSGRGYHEAPPMSTSRSQRSTNMARTSSKGSSSSNASMPWTNTGRVPPPLLIETYAANPEEPMSTYTLGQYQQPAVRSLSNRKPELERVQEIDSGLLPSEFFAQSNAMPLLPTNPAHVDLPANGEWRSPNIHRGSFSSHRSPSFGIQTPETPSTTTLTDATTYMSRESSFSNDVLGPFDMLNVRSNNSFGTDIYSADDISYQSGDPCCASYPKLFSSEDQGLLVAGAGASHDLSFALSQDSGASTAPYQDLHPFLERSESSESHVSAASTRSRGTTALQRQVQLALARPLAPKAGAEEVSTSPAGSHTMVSIKSNDGSEDRVVAQIPKAPYQRPKHARVFCDVCTDYPDGFRGLHELSRHQDRQHKDHVKKWMCIEPLDGIINSEFKPLNPLSRCKSCQGKKKYGAYYNAAAHLRRAHFRPKARGRSKSTKVEDKSEKRGGKAGGDWPSMPELKRWMKEVLVKASENQRQEADEEADDDDESGSYEFADGYTKKRGKNKDSSDCDSPDLLNDATMTDVDHIPTLNYNSQGMQNMSYDDNIALQQRIELSAMHVDLSQSSYVDSQLTSMGDPMAFIGNFPVPHYDMSLSHDLFDSFPYQM